MKLRDAIYNLISATFTPWETTWQLIVGYRCLNNIFRANYMSIGRSGKGCRCRLHGTLGLIQKFSEYKPDSLCICQRMVIFQLNVKPIITTNIKIPQVISCTKYKRVVVEDNDDGGDAVVRCRCEVNIKRGTGFYCMPLKMFLFRWPAANLPR